MKRTIAAMLAAVLSLAILAGCGAKPAEEAPAAGSDTEAKAASDTPTLDRIKAEGKLVIGTSPDYPPYEFLDEQNNIIGFDIDIMQAVADKLGVELEIVDMQFSSLIPALQAKKFDIMAAGVSITEERKEVVAFSKPYVVGSNAVVVHKDSEKEIKSLEDLAGLTVAVQMGTIQADAMHEIEGVTVKEYNLFTEAASAVSAKQADAMFISGNVARAFAAQDPNLKIVHEEKAPDTAYAFRKDTPDLVAFVNEVLDELQSSGKMDELVLKWFK